MSSRSTCRPISTMMTRKYHEKYFLNMLKRQYPVKHYIVVTKQNSKHRKNIET